jgi:hypothetical protein
MREQHPTKRKKETIRQTLAGSKKKKKKELPSQFHEQRISNIPKLQSLIY